MSKSVFENLYSPNLMFDDVVPLKQMSEKYNYNLVNQIYIYTDTKKNIAKESDENSQVVQNHIKSFLHGQVTN